MGRLRSGLVGLFTRSFTERNPVVIGAISLAVIFTFVAAALFLNKNVFGGGKGVVLRFTNAAGLRAGDQVLLAGVPVGEVKSLDQKGDFVYAHITIDGSTDLPDDSSATIEVETLLGQVAVKLVAGHDWGHQLAAGAMISDTTVPTEFQQLQNAAGPLLAQSNGKELSDLLGELATITNGKRTQVSELISGLDKLTATIDDRKSQVGQLIDGSDQVATALASRDQQLASAVTNLETVLAGLAQRRAALSDLITNVGQVAGQTASLVGDNRARLDSLLSALNADLDLVARHQVDLAQGLSYLASAVEGFQSVGYSGAQQYPNSWANVYTNLVGGGDQVLGSCGYLDQALDAALGPDPYSCNQRVGPVVAPSSSPGPSSGAALPSLLSPLVGGR
ncbi:MAG TPA: MCE family protein [Acidimicrobiales bacterium]|nr:MCE family protein [Acidimicrobiales bacterium]